MTLCLLTLKNAFYRADLNGVYGMSLNCCAIAAPRNFCLALSCAASLWSGFRFTALNQFSRLQAVTHATRLDRFGGRGLTTAFWDGSQSLRGRVGWDLISFQFLTIYIIHKLLSSGFQIRRKIKIATCGTQQERISSVHYLSNITSRRWEARWAASLR